MQLCNYAKLLYNYAFYVNVLLIMFVVRDET